MSHSDVNVIQDSLQRATNLYGIPLKVVTWNVNGKIDTAEEIREKILFPSYYEIPTDDPRLVVIGLQEMVELSAANVLENSVVKVSSSSDRFVIWRDIILQILQEKNPKFVFVGGDSLVGIALMVFCESDLYSSVRNIQVQKLPRGVGGVLGNKGAVYLRMDLMDSSICFISAHFAAHREKVKKRNEDYHAILTTPVFSDNYEQLSSMVAPHWGNTEQQRIGKLRSEVDRVKRRLNSVVQNFGSSRGTGSSSTHQLHAISGSTSDLHQAIGSSRDRTYSSSDMKGDRNSGSNNNDSGRPFAAMDHDVIVFVGDLNYRIVASVDIQEVYEMIHSHELLRLASYDQLCQEREKNTVFSNFNEGLLTFPPTYQFIPGENVYDDRKDKKMRCPAWCDRILWRCGRPQKGSSPRLQRGRDNLLHIHTEDDLSEDEDHDDDGAGDINLHHMSHRSIETTRAQIGSPFPFPLETPKPTQIASPTNRPAPGYRETSLKRKKAFFPLTDDSDRPPDSDDDSEYMEDHHGIVEINLAESNSNINLLDAIPNTSSSTAAAPTTMDGGSSNATTDESLPTENGDKISLTHDILEKEEEEKEDVSLKRISRPLPLLPLKLPDMDERDSLRNRSLPSTNEIDLVSLPEESFIDEDEIGDSDDEDDTRMGDTVPSPEVAEAAERRLSRRVSVSQKERTEAIARRLLARNSMRLTDDPEFVDYVRRSSIRLSTSNIAPLDNVSSGVVAPPPPLPPSTFPPPTVVTENKPTHDNIISEIMEPKLSFYQQSPVYGGASPKKEQTIEESIELISYHSCTNVISDHKPVCALMWLRVRRIDWPGHEQRLMRCYAPLLQQVDVRPLHHPTALDLTWHRLKLVTAPAPLFQPDLHKQQQLQPQLFRYRHATQVNPFHSSPAMLQPTCVLLRSVNKDGAIAVIEVTNRSPALPAVLELDMTSVPDWLSVTMASAVVLPQHGVQVTLKNDHTLSTLQLVQDVDTYRDYAQENLRSIGKYLQLPPNDPAMQIVAFVRMSLTWSMEATTALLNKQQLQQQATQSLTQSIPTTQQVETQYILKLVEGAARGEKARQRRRSLLSAEEEEETPQDNSSGGLAEPTVQQDSSFIANVKNQISIDVDHERASDAMPRSEKKKTIDILPAEANITRSFILPVVCSLAMDQSL